jgi:hypothetical protein
MRDADFLAEAEKGRLEVTPVAGADVEKLVQDVYATPSAIVQKASAMLQ